jgi:hypothetical protein
MSGLGTGHVREIPLKSGRETGYAWLTWEKAERPGISDQSLRNPTRGSDMSGLIGVFGARIDF